MALGSWFSSLVHDVGGWVAGDGNTPGTPDTRKLGYDPTQVADASAIYLSAPAPVNPQEEVAVLGLAGLALILLIHHADRS